MILAKSNPYVGTLDGRPVGTRCATHTPRNHRGVTAGLDGLNGLTEKVRIIGFKEMRLSSLKVIGQILLRLGMWKEIAVDRKVPVPT